MRLRILILTLLFAHTTNADLITYTATLDGLQIIPSASDLALPPSAATGTMQLIIDTDTETFSFNANLHNLEGNYLPCFMPMTICSGAHLHLGPPGSASPTHLYNTLNTLWLNENGNQDPATGDWTYAATNQSFIGDFATAKTALDAGNVYFNVHTEYITSGEIRGQLSAVPEPRSILLLALGTLLLRPQLRHP